jgi:serine/threonine-protein kinase RsbW
MLAVARAFVEAVCHTCELDRSTTHAVILATGEAVTNVIRHAHCDCPQAAVQVQVHLGPDFLEVDVLDEGAPFDLDAVPHLDPAELRVGGRGVYLMRALMDELSCRPRHARGNILRMVKRWTPQSSVAARA